MRRLDTGITAIVSVAFLLYFPLGLAFVPPITPPPLQNRRTIASMAAAASPNESESLGPLVASETAFVCIEYQNEFCSPGGKLHDAVKECMDATNMLPTSIQTITAARQAGCTIVHCPIQFEPGHHEISSSPYGILAGVKNGGAFTAREWGADFVNGMKPVVPGDLIVKGKSGLCGFASTNLDFLLRQHGAKNVVLCGFLTNCCVESTMRTAYEKGYKVYTLKDCVAATSLAAQDATLEFNFGMFSIPTTSAQLLTAIQREPAMVAN
jgi:nicotinamidase-related amidase